MTGSASRTVIGSIFASLFFFVLSFHSAAGSPGKAQPRATPVHEAMLEPEIVLPTPTPAFWQNIIAESSGPAVQKQITENECCPYPKWTSDSEWILYVDSLGAAGTGLYGVPADGGPPTFLTSQLGSFSYDLSLVAYPESGLVYIERWADGERWLVPSQGREVYISRENEWIAWEYGSTAIQNQDLLQRTIWVANLRGEEAHELVTIHGGRFIGWIDAGKALLVSGRLSPLSPSGIWRIDRESGAGRLLFETDRPRDILISPAGEWLAFTLAFQSNKTQNGIWVLRNDGSSIKRLPVYGSYRWRADGELLIIPYDFDAPGPYILHMDLQDNEIWKLTDPAQTEIPIANNDWQPSPDGSRIVYFSSQDHNLWVVALPSPSD